MASDELPMTLEDLKARFEGDLNTRYTDEYLEIKLEEAIALVEGVPTVPTRLASGLLKPIIYKGVIARIVFRVTRNPGGVVSESEGGVSYGLRATVASGDLWVSDADREALTGITAETKKRFPGTTSIGVDNGWAS